MIEELQSGAREAVQVMNTGCSNARDTVEQAIKASSSLDNIVSSVATITDMNLQIASAAEEQTSTVQEIDRNVVEISQLSQQSTQDTAQTAQSSRELVEVSNALYSLVAQFKV